MKDEQTTNPTDERQPLPEVIPATFPVFNLSEIKDDKQIYPLLLRVINDYPDLIEVFRGRGLNNRQKLFLCAYYRCAANNSAASKLVGVHAHHTWMKNDVDYAEVVEQITETVIDAVELKLFQFIERDSLSAIQFFLKNKAKHRGYGNEVKVDANINFNQEVTTLLQAARKRVSKDEQQNAKTD
jgi:hypothetical protein